MVLLLASLAVVVSSVGLHAFGVARTATDTAPVAVSDGGWATPVAARAAVETDERPLAIKARWLLGLAVLTAAAAVAVVRSRLARRSDSAPAGQPSPGLAPARAPPLLPA